ncbi:MAG: SGNH/GDSL hydrolase family protein [Victivallales bacterium]|nr:SGNH/GDSL hydrolase family protein [Victivallales bacterium]
MKLTEIDRNFSAAGIGDRTLAFFDAMAAPAVLSGFPWYDGNGPLFRLPEALLPRLEPGVGTLTFHTSGGMIRFRTDAVAMAIDAELYLPSDMSHMPRNGSAGFDFYLGSGVDKAYYNSAMPDQGRERLTFMAAEGLEPGVMREWTVYLPLYGGVRRVRIGVTPGSTVAPPSPFFRPEPVVFYGSSITQGGCASRTGNSFTNLLCRWFDVNQVNLGFSGCGRGEAVLAAAIATLPMSVFVLDYDHNAQTPEELEQTHEPFFRIIRERRPDLPVIMISRCDSAFTPDAVRRREIIRRTYDRAVGGGDRKVWYIDGSTLFAGPDRDSCTVDRIHPNDLGFYRMATVIRPILQEALAAAAVK